MALPILALIGRKASEFNRHCHWGGWGDRTVSHQCVQYHSIMVHTFQTTGLLGAVFVFLGGGYVFTAPSCVLNFSKAACELCYNSGSPPPFFFLHLIFFVIASCIHRSDLHLLLPFKPYAVNVLSC